MRSLRIAAITAAGLLALAASDAVAQSHMGMGHMGGRGGGGGLAIQGATADPPPHHGGIRHDGRFVNDGRFVHDGHIVNDGHFGHDGRFVHDGRFRHDGRFVHTMHGGRLGWWWVSGAVWTPWPQYVVAEPAVTAVWYFCPSAGAYYPYVTTCPDPWVQVVPVEPAP